MNFLILCTVGIAVILALVPVVIGIRHAPEGYEDELGFHEGRLPSRAGRSDPNAIVLRRSGDFGVEWLQSDRESWTTHRELAGDWPNDEAHSLARVHGGGAAALPMTPRRLRPESVGKRPRTMVKLPMTTRNGVRLAIPAVRVSAS